MKNNNIVNQTGFQNTQFNKNKQAPEVRDNLDSHKNEEKDSKGDDISHNRKVHHGKQQKVKK